MERDTTHDVIREFGVDFVYFDLILLSTFLFLLIRNKKTGALWSFFIGAFLIYAVDVGLFYHVSKIRKVHLPETFMPFIKSEYLKVIIFMIWFDCTYGISFSYVYIMLERHVTVKSKILWTLLISVGWTSVALLSQHLPIQDDQITCIREMEGQRNAQFFFLGFYYVLLLPLLGYKIKGIIYCAFVGLSVYFYFEFSLWVSGIRRSDGGIFILIFNSIVEGGTFFPPVFLVMDKIISSKSKKHEK